MIRPFTIGILAALLVGCLDSDQAVQVAETVDSVAEGAGGLGIPYASLAALATGAFAEWVRGRRDKKKLSEQAGAVFHAVDAHLGELSEADKKAAKDLMRQALVASLGEDKAAKAKEFLAKAKDIAKKS